MPSHIHPAGLIELADGVFAYVQEGGGQQAGTPLGVVLP